ncbi:MAG: phosphodiester glycosidase family protein, partial [Clostridia bacterium]|nr:phosphodiester glycosidase family protein [Clostridia bacterium]
KDRNRDTEDFDYIEIRRRPHPARPADKTVRRSPQGKTGGEKRAAEERPARKQVREPVKKEKKEKRSAASVIGRAFFALLLAIVLVFVAVFSVVYSVAHGPSESLRNQLVIMALTASATKWVPGLFLTEETVEEIYENSQKVREEVISIDDVTHPPAVPGEKTQEEKINWENAIDGLLYLTETRSGFKAYIVLIRDPSRVFVGVSSDNFETAEVGMRIWQAADKYKATVVMNSGEFRDPGGQGTGGQPMGLTYSEGKCVWEDKYTTHTFIGFDQNDKLIVVEGMTRSKAEKLGIRDAVMFQNGNALLTNDGTSVTAYRKSEDVGTAQRTAIGQRADGSVIFVVTDGRTAASIGATYDDMVDLMLSYGAVTAAMLDGGSSSLLYYRDYARLYGIDEAELDDYQKMGIVNKYKAFTYPRRLPTFFMVRPGGDS